MAQPLFCTPVSVSGLQGFLNGSCRVWQNVSQFFQFWVQCFSRGIIEQCTLWQTKKWHCLGIAMSEQTGSSKRSGPKRFGALLFLLEVSGSDVKRMKIGPASDALRERGLKLDTRHCENLQDAWMRFCVATDSVAELKTPKRHIVWHMTASSRHLGNQHH